MEAINDDDIKVIQRQREHRNDLAHNLPERLDVDHMDRNFELLNLTKGHFQVKQLSHLH